MLYQSPLIAKLVFSLAFSMFNSRLFLLPQESLKLMKFLLTLTLKFFNQSLVKPRE
jgi:hypothetical protein